MNGLVPPLESFTAESPEFVQARAEMLERHSDWKRFLETAFLNVGRRVGDAGFATEDVIASLGDVGPSVPRNLIGAVTAHFLHREHMIRAVGRRRSTHREAHGRGTTVYVLTEAFR
jgi:hypothetical protein